jgi:hypothetical protein
MGSIQRKKQYSVVGAGLLALLVVSVSQASCGSNNNKSLGGDLGSSSGGDDASTCGGMSFTACADDASDGSLTSSSGSSSGFMGDDSGLINVGMKSGKVNDSNCTNGPLSATQLKAVQAGGASAGALKWLYPYDQTVFPGGIAPPTLQWSQSGNPDGIYVHITSQLYEYQGCYKGTNPGQLTLPEIEWATAFAQSKGGSQDPVTVELSTITGSTVSSIKETWLFAKGSLRGTIYYNTYNSTIAGNNGAVMMLPAGATKPTALLNIPGVVPTGPCISCHSLSADGSMLAAQKHFYPGGLTTPGSMTFDLAMGLPNSTNPSPLASDVNDDWGFSAVYPDGSLLLTAGESASSTATTAVFPFAPTNNPGMIGPVSATMFDTKAGSKITFTGLADPSAMMPMFSPDGKHIVYNDITNDGGHALVMQDYDNSTHTFSNQKVIYKDASEYPGWPFFTPDGLAVVFVMGPSSDFASIPPASFSDIGPVQASASDVTTSDLYITYLASPGAKIALDAANGFKNGNSYLPFPGRDEHLSFYPTVMPVSAGGYFWVFFTSRRQYGNLMVDTTNNNAIPLPVFQSESKKIWAAAISIGQTSGDPSHPAFEFPGQELTSGNIRAFAVLSPCKGDGASCESGLDCCGGSCTMNNDGGMACGVPMACAGEGDKCSATTPCCLQSDQCIGGYCGFIAK